MKGKQSYIQSTEESASTEAQNQFKKRFISICSKLPEGFRSPRKSKIILINGGIEEQQQVTRLEKPPRQLMIGQPQRKERMASIQKQRKSKIQVTIEQDKRVKNEKEDSPINKLRESKIIN